MPRQASSFIENSFVKGLITEATGLNFPEQAVTETTNCVFDEKGIVSRRKGIDLEFGFSTLAVSKTDKAISVYLWEAAAGDGDNAIVVLQVGNTLYFYLTDGDTVSDNQFDSLDISTFLPSGSTATTSDVECQFAAGKGFLFVAHPFLESFYCTYDQDTVSVSATLINPSVRDFEGVDDGLELDERPASLTDAHNYNLHNQGWDVHLIDYVGGGQDYPLTRWDTLRADFPSNSDVWFIFKQASGFDPVVITNDYGNSPRPKGHYVLDYYNQDRNTATAINPLRTWTGLTTTTSGIHRCSSIAFFAGRVWYAGCKGTGYSNRILFSQIIEDDEQIGFCYQSNDPTSEDLFDLLPSDGGTILIPDSGTIVKLFAFEDSILVFTTNGVWKVAGSEGIGFRANDYSVVKLSSIPTLSASSFVSIAGTPSFWNTEGIYTMQPQPETGGTAGIVSITDTSIKSFLDDIPYESKKYVKGIYNRSTRIVTWVYRTTAPTTVTQRYTFDGVLNLNTLSSAFYGWTVNTTNVSINGVLVALAKENAGSAQIVTDNALATVTDGALATVYAFGDASVRTADVTKFVVSYGSNITFADEWNTGYVDWYSYDNTGVNYSSTFTTGYKVHGDGQRKVQPTYINLFFDTSEVDSSLDFRSIWQYANVGSTGRWSTAQRVVTTSNDYDYTRKRLKSRGSGTAYQFQVASVAGEAFNLIGWSVFETQNSNA